ncbi:MAG TPA: DUF4304 domain-containing protein [Flavobacteriaceae bacterium]|jgi:hypothetical protein
MINKDLNKEFNSIIRDIISPIFKDLGFKKKGNNFYRDFGDTGQAFNIQQSRWNSKDHKTFVFNVGLLEKIIYQEINNLHPPTFPQEVDCNIRLRLSKLTDKTDGWYDLKISTDLNKLKSQIEQDLNSYVVPFFENYKDPNKWMEMLKWNREPFIESLDKFLLIEKYGKRKTAENFLNQVYFESITAKPKTNIPSKKFKQYLDKVNQEWIKKIETLAKKKKVKLKMSSGSFKNNDQIYNETRTKSRYKLWSKLKSLWS